MAFHRIVQKMLPILWSSFRWVDSYGFNKSTRYGEDHGNWIFETTHVMSLRSMTTTTLTKEPSGLVRRWNKRVLFVLVNMHRDQSTVTPFARRNSKLHAFTFCTKNAPSLRAAAGKSWVQFAKKSPPKERKKLLPEKRRLKRLRGWPVCKEQSKTDF